MDQQTVKNALLVVALLIMVVGVYVWTRRPERAKNFIEQFGKNRQAIIDRRRGIIRDPDGLPIVEPEIEQQRRRWLRPFKHGRRKA